ncbi:hypothetical protein [Pseudarthrobacter sp. S9]|uniref:hypothetical protein n=1 Tax=Pseudarthrobacter sp. S9 TaxID=3418421 RepID=UPI003D0569B1
MKVPVFAKEPRFTLRAAPRVFKKAGTHTPGIGVFSDLYLVQHLTQSEALALADQLVDAAEQIEQEEN